jgi:hypothetical protein
MGIISSAMDDLIMTQVTQGMQDGKLAQAISAGFYKRTLLTSYTEATRVASMKIGQTFLNRLARDVLGEGTAMYGLIKTGAAFQNSGKILLRELGIEDAKQTEFARWLRSKDAVTFQDMKDGEMGALYRTAVARFVDQTIIHPTGATRARYANHPIGSLFYNLQSYIYGFQKNVLNRTGNMALTALTREGLNPLERAQLLAPMMLLPVLYPIQAGLNELRDVIWEDPAKKYAKPQPESQKVVRNLSRAGFTGSADMLVNMVTGARYNRDPATVLLGPILGAPSELFSKAVGLTGDRNSDNTNTAERQASRSFYNFVIQPTLAAAGAIAPGRIGGVLGGVAIQAASHPAVREAAVRAVAGAPVPARGSEAAKSTAPDRNANRSVNRSVNRSLAR